MLRHDLRHPAALPAVEKLLEEHEADLPDDRDHAMAAGPAADQHPAILALLRDDMHRLEAPGQRIDGDPGMGRGHAEHGDSSGFGHPG